MKKKYPPTVSIFGWLSHMAGQIIAVTGQTWRVISAGHPWAPPLLPSFSLPKSQWIVAARLMRTPSSRARGAAAAVAARLVAAHACGKPPSMGCRCRRKRKRKRRKKATETDSGSFFFNFGDVNRKIVGVNT